MMKTLEYLTGITGAECRRLRALGIKHTNRLLHSTSLIADRQRLSRKTGMSEERLLELANQCALLEISEQDWRDHFAVNIDGAWHACRAVVPSMIERRRGAVVNMASWMGKRGWPNYGAYCATKFAVIGFTQSLAYEVAPHGVRVNAVCPGMIVNTKMREAMDEEAPRRGLPTSAERVAGIPLKRAGTPEDVAKATVFLASDEAACLTDSTVDVAGGLWMS